MDAQARKIRQEIMREYRTGIAELQAKQRAALEAERQELLALKREAIQERRLARQQAAAERRVHLVLLFRGNSAH